VHTGNVVEKHEKVRTTARGGNVDKGSSLTTTLSFLRSR
jgi:hypothetical protein